jgi:hypothetical protein
LQFWVWLDDESFVLFWVAVSMSGVKHRFAGSWV